MTLILFRFINRKGCYAKINRIVSLIGPSEKIVISLAPRQCAKIFLQRDWDITQKLVIFDELHKL